MPVTTAAQAPPAAASVLLVSSNGAGMGHLTRLLAYARRLPATTRRHVLSLSQAVPVVASEGLPWEYLPSHGATGLRPASWRALFAERLARTLDRLDPDVLVFDGTHPYTGLDAALAAHPRTRAVWSRRGMWKTGRNVDQLAKSSWFDLVLEPGDLAGAVDPGASADATGAAAAHRVAPVTLVDRAELTSRQLAREALGLPAEGPLALVALGAGNINDTDDEVGAAAAALRAQGVGVCVTAPSIAARAYSGADVHLVRHFPLSEHFAAFDLAVAAPGYNSFHEALRLGVPTAFVPNRATSLDDQVARARYAASRGWALSVDTLTGGAAGGVVEQLLTEGSSLAEAALAADPGNGAQEAADLILGTARSAAAR
ncbi:UDP-N-acetylglucosamine--LPS N-acetylglucosamine transferase [Serinicoccus kebangsaanensis]|uniref:UDP-N-acetylglucosamine--LPS N-acetylglucosamine transferase n=1 Tax=Serinicoccus kebangsaanensis TaxID=2602069 RepID=UPI00124BE11F|nr:UDP-N-acetylglucosamine--LPS N-acetylglucosamine transferase [Serinicoccus kebangsaanensis]